MDFDKIVKRISETSSPTYWRFVAENDGICCKKCCHFDDKVFRDDDPAKPVLPLHPHCRCSLRKATVQETGTAMEILTPRTPSFVNRDLNGTILKIKNVYDFQIPKPPRETNNEANWLHMTWMWFFEQGKNPIMFDRNSLESRDIANSYSIKELKKDFFRSGKIPKLWQFTGSGTATGNYGEVEWFLGSYSIKDFKLENGIASFTVYNKSGWRSGTRLPKSWSDAIRDKTTFEISELVTDAPRGEVIKTKIQKFFPNASKIPGFKHILELLPSYGGDWEQYYEIRMEWKK